MNKFPTTQKKVDINDVFPNNWNCNQQDPKTFEKEKKSIKTKGFLVPLLVREVDGGIYEIIDGYHRWRACTELGYTEILVESLGRVSDDQAKALTIDLNNLRGSDDIIKRAEILKSISGGQGFLFSLDEEQIKEEIKLLDFDPTQYQGAVVGNEQVDSAKLIVQTAYNLEKLLRSLHDNSDDVKLRLLIEQYLDWFRVFKSSIDKATPSKEKRTALPI